MPEPGCSFEEFRVYYESTELVSDRRIATTRWNYSVCVAVIGGVALLIKLALEKEAFFALGLAAAALVAGIAAIFSYLWLRQIDDYKSLNNAKFSVLNEMAPRLRFETSGEPETHSNAIKSFEPFQREWEALKQSRSLVEVRGSRLHLAALSASNIERFLPKCFLLLFAGTVVLCVALAFSNLSEFADSVQCTVGGVGDKECVVVSNVP
jgi:hypothetical protein